MTHEEAMAIVDAGGFVSRESLWTPVEAGFSWGPWISLERRWTEEDAKREKERLLKGDWNAPCIASSGPYCRALHTLCETIMLIGGDDPKEWLEATDWFDASEHFENGWLRAHTEYLAANRAATG